MFEVISVDNVNCPTMTEVRDLDTLDGSDPDADIQDTYGNSAA